MSRASRWQEFLDQLEIVEINLPISLIDLTIKLGFATTKGEAKRLIAQQGIQVNPVFNDFPITIGSQVLTGSANWHKIQESNPIIDKLPLPGMLIRKSRRIIKWLQQAK